MNYTKEIIISSSPEKVFEALTDKLESWWGRIEDTSSKLPNTFKVHFGKAFWQFEITQFVPTEILRWKCTDGQPDFENEWVGTELIWKIRPTNELVTLHFTHDGLTPDFECYDVCAPTWDMFIAESLKSFVETGKGMPHL